MKTTPWFPRSVRPARPGVYERRVQQRYSYWDGKHWLLSSSSIEEAAAMNDEEMPSLSGSQFGQWRGLSEKPA